MPRRHLEYSVVPRGRHVDIRNILLCHVTSDVALTCRIINNAAWGCMESSAIEHVGGSPQTMGG